MTETDEVLILMFWASQWLRSGMSLKEVCVKIHDRSRSEIKNLFGFVMQQSILGISLDEACLNSAVRTVDVRVRLFLEVLAESSLESWTPPFTAQALEELQKRFSPYNLNLHSEEAAAIPSPEKREGKNPIFFLNEVREFQLGAILYGLDIKRVTRLQNDLRAQGFIVEAVEASDARAAAHRFADLYIGNHAALNREIVNQQLARKYILFFEVRSNERSDEIFQRVSEMCAYRDGGFWCQQLTWFESSGIDRAGKETGSYSSFGFIPNYVSRLEFEGVRISRSRYNFDESK